MTTRIRVTSCGDCPLIKRHHLGWSEGECQHPKAPDDNQTKTLMNKPSWCPLKGETVLMAALAVAIAETNATIDTPPVERRSSWERIMDDESV